MRHHLLMLSALREDVKPCHVQNNTMKIIIIRRCFIRYEYKQEDFFDDIDPS